MTILDLEAYKMHQFERMAEKIIKNPGYYLDFDSVADFYKAVWLNDFPQGTTFSATGLDDGAECFYAVIEYKQKKINISIDHDRYHVDYLKKDLI